MKRFWTTAGIAPDGGGWRVELDGKPVRLPGGTRLHVPLERVAEAVAAEWRDAPAAFTHDDVPLTRLAGTAQERIAPDPTPVARELARYGESDLLCYRAEWPPELAALEAAAWDPWLDWAADTLGARLIPTAGVTHVAQSGQALAAIGQALAARPSLALAALGIAVPALGSVVLGLALADGALDATEAHRLATLDESFQAERWGWDEVAVERRSRIGAELATCARLLELVRGGSPA